MYIFIKVITDRQTGKSRGYGFVSRSEKRTLRLIINIYSWMDMPVFCLKR